MELRVGRPAHPKARPRPAGAWHQDVRALKRQLLTARLAEHGNNRTHGARSLGLSRTYLVRLLRELELDLPPAVRWRG